MTQQATPVFYRYREECKQPETTDGYPSTPRVQRILVRLRHQIPEHDPFQVAVSIAEM